MKLFRRSSGAAKGRTVEQWGSWARGHRVGLAAKYGSSAQGSEKRSSGTNLYVVFCLALSCGYKEWGADQMVL